MTTTGEVQNDKAVESELLNHWEATGYRQLSELRLYDPKHRQITNVGDTLPSELSLSGAILIFLSTLSGQSKQTHKTYRVGCRRLMWFVYSTDRGDPASLPVVEMPTTILEDFYLWLVETYGKTNRATIGAYLAGARNLFEFLSSRELSPGGVQYSRLVARLGKLQGRASYKTPDTLRIKGRQAQIEQVAHLAATQPLSLIRNEETITGSEISDRSNKYSAEAKIALPVPLTEDIEITDVPTSARSSHRKARSLAEIERQRLEELRDRALILTLFTTGMRREEVIRLERADLEPLVIQHINYVKSIGSNGVNENEPTQRPVYELIITGKGQKERVVYFDGVTLVAIGEYLVGRDKDPYRPLFLQHHRGRDKVRPGTGGQNYRVGDRTVWIAVKKYAARLGLQLKPHDFRHNLATTLLNAGAQLSEVQDILGHASPTTTKQIYAHYDKGHLKEAFARFAKSASSASELEN